MNKKFWCISVIFNPAGYRSRVDNYHRFRDRLEQQKTNLLTIELTFNDHTHTIPDAVKLHSNSVMWQKERLINHALTLLPPECEYVAWLDADLLLPDGWADMATDRLQSVDFVQLFERIIHLPPGEKSYGRTGDTKSGIIWQKKTYGDDWLRLRAAKKIYHAEPGFGWAARRQAVGLYDRLICGSGDNFLADCLLGSSGLHHYVTKFTDHMRADMADWEKEFGTRTDKSYDYLPIDVCHLWHGASKNRGYMTRDLIFRQHDFDPRTDITISNNVWEWATAKPQFHQAIINYFESRKEDDAHAD